MWESHRRQAKSRQNKQTNKQMSEKADVGKRKEADDPEKQSQSQH